ncbi:MAG: hypothetical protein U1D30_18225 [Planctomycetota bacterium]
MVATRLERATLFFLLLAAVALSLNKIDTTDTPYHLATAKYAFQTGHWPTTNTFSYTFPDYPLYQQYPVYQSLLYAVYWLGGWEGLSLLHCVGWTLVYFLWMRWGGSYRWAAVLSIAWVIALLGLQRRMVLRPDLVTLMLLGILFHLVDLYRKGHAWAVAGFVFVQFLMANSHQLFPLGLATQGVLLIHLLMVRFLGGRFGISREDADVPLLPVIIGLLFSIGTCFATPLGFEILRAPEHTAGSLGHHRLHVSEFVYVTSDEYSFRLVLLAGGLALAGWYWARRNWNPLEIGLWLMGLALVVAALRGTAFFVLISIGVFSRFFTRAAEEDLRVSGRVNTWSLPRNAMALVTMAISLWLVSIRWIDPPRVLGRVQPGIGRTLGFWPDHAVSFLKDHPPPGRMINLSWYSGNVLTWELYPKHPVFVDPRFEAFPREFLLRSIQAQEDGQALDELIEKYQPDWMVAEVRLPTVVAQAARLWKSGAWSLIYVDTEWIILVRDTPMTADYLAEYRMTPEQIHPPDLFMDEPDLLGLQWLRVAEVHAAFGERERAIAAWDNAKALSVRYANVAAAEREFSERHPEITGGREVPEKPR